jgi:hypothetical protein
MLRYRSFLIIFLVRHHRRQIQSQQAAVSTNTDTVSQTKLSITMGYVIGVSLFCYTPAWFVSQLYMSNDKPNPSFFNSFILTMALQLTSSCFNPIIYCWRRQDIRQPTVAMIRNIFSKLKLDNLFT